jgi:hypothetical protein
MALDVAGSTIGGRRPPHEMFCYQLPLLSVMVNWVFLHIEQY